jgi:regulator of sigma E protease
MYAEGVRAGDEIVSVNDQPYQDLNTLFLTFLKGSPVTLDIRHPEEGTQPLIIHMTPPKEGESTEVKIPLIPFTTAQYVIYDPSKLTSSDTDVTSGIQKNDVLSWFDGAMVYSPNQLAGIILENKALLTVQRGNEIYLRRAPRIQVGSIKLDAQFKEELTDWQYESDLIKKKLSQLSFIPYVVNSENTVEFPARFIDKEDAKSVFPTLLHAKVDEPLQEGDKILAVDGIPVKHPYQLFKQLQSKRYLSVVYRDPNFRIPGNYEEAIALFKKIHSERLIDPLLNRIGTTDALSVNNNFHMLLPIEMNGEAADETLVPSYDNLKNPKNQIPYLKHVLNASGVTKGVDIQIPKQRNPFEMMVMSVVETYVPIYLLVTGKAKMDMVRGPIGVFEVVAQGLMEGLTNALYTLGFISLNLALINLLPFPVLDGGSIVISTFEKFSGRRLTIRALERLIIPFALLILFAMVFFTFNDIMRFFKG